MKQIIAHEIMLLEPLDIKSKVMPSGSRISLQRSLMEKLVKEEKAVWVGKHGTVINIVEMPQEEKSKKKSRKKLTTDKS